MPTKTTETNWKKYMTIIRDVVFIILFLTSIAGWITSETKKKTKLEAQVEELTKTMDQNTKQLEKITDIIMQQAELNGKIIQHIETDN